MNQIKILINFPSQPPQRSKQIFNIFISEIHFERIVVDFLLLSLARITSRRAYLCGGNLKLRTQSLNLCVGVLSWWGCKPLSKMQCINFWDVNMQTLSARVVLNNFDAYFANFQWRVRFLLWSIWLWFDLLAFWFDFVQNVASNWNGKEQYWFFW